MNTIVLERIKSSYSLILDIFNIATWSEYLIVLYVLIVVAFSIRIITHTDTPSKGLAYLLLIISFPLIGIILYLSVGFNYRKRKLYQKKMEIDEASFPILERAITNYSQSILDRMKPQLGRFYPLAKLRFERSIISDNNTVELLINGENKFPDVLQTLRSAKHHIHIEYYIYEDDDIGNQIADILIAKAQAGVEVRFIYDDFGSRDIRKKLVKRMQEAGVETSPFYKINLIRIANRVNYRNHRKIIVVDGITGYVGGINVSDKYVNNGKHNLFWRDTHLKITGTSVLNLQFVFLTDWNFCSGKNISISVAYFPVNHNITFGNTLVQVVSSGPDSDYQSTMYSLIQVIMAARQELLITTPYFIPDKSFLDAIKIAALSGVKVQLLVPGISDSLIVNTTSESYYSEVMRAGVEIYRYQKGFVHAKTLVCDRNIAVVGTVNLDNRSFDLNFEIHAVVFDETTAVALAQQFEADLKDAKLLTKQVWKNRPRYKKLAQKVLHLFSPLM